MRPGALFFAVPGAHVDGHDYAATAVAEGAIGVVVEHEVPEVSAPQLVVDRTRRALADAADAWFGRPSERLEVIGITGTDGKTTSSFLAIELLRAGGRRPGMVGTVAIDIGDERTPNDDRTTTPEALELHELMARMVEAGNDSVVLEATSHGLALERTRNCRFDVGVLTSVTSEHLEFHGSMDAYRSAKARLFEESPTSILNADDPAFAFFRERARDRVLSYAIEADADLRATEISADADGSRFALGLPNGGGRSCADAGAVQRQQRPRSAGHRPRGGHHLGGCDQGARQHRRRPGAHGEGRGGPALRGHRRLRTHRRLPGQGARMLRAVSGGRLIVVFGSAGERDPTKRAPMGRVAADLADLVVVTDEDPRLEDPRTINEQIADGARSGGAADGERLWVIDDRREAIAHAIGAARHGDVILLAGKGHEESIFYGTDKRPWDDRDVAREALAAAGWGSADGE